MVAERGDVRQHGDTEHTERSQQLDGSNQIRLPFFEKGRLHRRVAALAREISGHPAHRLIGRFHARAVGENDDPSLLCRFDQALWI